MGTKTRLSSYCTKRGENAVYLVTSRITNARLAPLFIGSKSVVKESHHDYADSQ